MTVTSPRQEVIFLRRSKAYVAVETETLARSLEQVFQIRSDKAIAKKRFFSN
jgi:hypothetical protein